MKKFLLITAFGLFVSFANNNVNAVPCDMNGCSATIAADSGVTAKQCLGIGGVDGCSCTVEGMGCNAVKIVAAGTSCGSSWWYQGNLVDGRKCCGQGPACLKAANTQEIQETITSPESDSLNEVFETSLDLSRDGYHYGYINGVNRSPTGGRGASAVAKLDACLSHSDVDAISDAGGTMEDKLNRCYGSTYGCAADNKNEYCKNSGTNDSVPNVSAAVCKDRCDCIYGGNCEGI